MTDELNMILNLGLISQISASIEAFAFRVLALIVVMELDHAVVVQLEDAVGGQQLTTFCLCRQKT